MSPLVQFALRGLEHCWLPEHGCFSHALRLNGDATNVSVPESDVYYTLNVLLGLAKIKDQPLPWDLAALFRANCERMVTLPVPIYAYGMAMWAAHELGYPLPAVTLAKIDRILADTTNWASFRAQDLGLMMTGTSHMALSDPHRWGPHVRALRATADRSFANTNSGLFRDAATGWRRHFGTYATNVYQILGYFHVGEALGDDSAIQRALKGVDALARCQGPMGEWPWFYAADAGKVVDPYQVYSVHQDGMAPAYLHLAAKHGHPTARAQIEHGFRWLFGENELGRSMLVRRYGVIQRAQRRKGPGERYVRGLRATAHALLPGTARWSQGNRLVMNRECRSYHLGWVIWSFGGRDDYPDITHHAEFSA